MLYGIGAGEQFAMEIEFKITSGRVLAIKQARPWVFSTASGEPAVRVTGLSDAGTAENAAWNSPAPRATGVTGAVTWSKEGRDAEDFAINSGTGVLTLPARDYENPSDADMDNVYEVTVKAEDGVGSTARTSITVTVADVAEGGGGGGRSGEPEPEPEPEPEADVPPTAAFTLSPDCAGSLRDLCSARTGVPVRFTDSSTGTVRQRLWEFGDGRRSRSRAVDHNWSEPGFYTVALTVGDGAVESTASRTVLVEASDPAGSCEPEVSTLCLQDSRYAVQAEWWTGDGQGGAASVVYAGTNDSGLFGFFDRENWEVLIKVLDGCELNGHVWVFGASATDLGYRVTVTDTATGRAREYRHERGSPAPAIADGTAFPEGCRP